MLARVHPATTDHRDVMLLDSAITHQLMQGRQGRAFLGNNQQPRRFAIQAMCQLQQARLGALLAQLLDYAKTHPTTAMDSLPRRLVEHKQGIIFIDHRQCVADRYDTMFARGTDLHRWNAHHIFGLKPIGLTRASTIHPDLPAAQKSINMTFRHAFQDAQQVVIDALSVRLRVDLFMPNFKLFALRHHPAIYLRSDRFGPAPCDFVRNCQCSRRQQEPVFCGSRPVRSFRS